MAENISIEDISTEQDLPKRKDLAYILMKSHQSNQRLLPDWSGFNVLLMSSAIPPTSKIRYLPIIDGSPSEYATIHTVLQRSLKIADQLAQQCVVLVFDEAIYAKIQQIRWKEEVFLNRFVVRLGAFHAIMSFLSAIARQFRDAGLQVCTQFCIEIKYII